MDITAVSDLHGHYPDLPGGDLLIIAGDLTAHDNPIEHEDFSEWLDVQPYTKKIVIAGNHDNNIDADLINCIRGCVYLYDSGTEFNGLKIWGSPWTKTFHGMNPDCTAFTVDTEEELNEKWDLIPDDIDVLITHSPFWLALDGIPNYQTDRIDYVGSKSLRYAIDRIMPKIFICGHIHENGGKHLVYKGQRSNTHCYNASHVNACYKPIHAPIRIVLP